MPARSRALPAAADATSSDGLVRRGPAAALDAGALLDPLVAGVDALEDLGVGDDPARPVAAEPEDARRAGAPVGGARWRRSCTATPSGCSRIERLAGGDRVAVLDEPLDDGAAVRGDDRRSRRGRSPPCRPRCPARARSPSAQVGGAGGRCPCAGRPASARSGAVHRRRRSPCLATKVAGVLEVGRGSSARTSRRRAGRAWRCPVRVPAGGTSMTPVTPRSPMVSHAEVPADRVARPG